jgi:hypothetical protein
VPVRSTPNLYRLFLILRLKFRVHPQKFLPPVLHSHKAAKAWVLLLQPRVKLTQNRASRTYCVPLFQAGRIALIWMTLLM